MRKTILLFCLLGAGFQVTAQKFTTKTGKLKFEASVDSSEEIAAENKSTSAILETSTGDIAVLGLIKGFRFKVALMEEHFNENYVESAKFPKTTFKGKIENFNVSELSPAPKTVKISGDLTLHGKTKKITVTAKISKTGDNIVVIGNFEVKPEDFDIGIPKIVRKKVADKVNIEFNLTLIK